uniref:NADH dehydrogenase subunit 6 n=1 Tax=Spisula sachalinensis TaxID=81899 RepID=A0A2H4U8Y9_SPISA|nr:NADH dehydrogenase subunit 6 [Pseudocardium sachalinense]
MWCVLISLLMCNEVLVKKVHPIRLASVTVVFGIISSASLTMFVSALLAVGYFLVLMGGVLVVFVYSVALVPMKLKKKKGGSKHMNRRWKKLYKIFFTGLLVTACLSEFSPSGFDFLFFTDCFYLSMSWGKMMVSLSLYLFLTMVVAARICKFQKGALIR